MFESEIEVCGTCCHILFTNFVLFRLFHIPNMTRKIQPAVCDFCAKDITTEMQYRLDINQKGSTKGQFVKCSNSADMCHDCFIQICSNGFKPKWVRLVKNDVTGKWTETGVEEYETQSLI